MLKRYETQRWWPGETRFEVMVGAVLTQATSWSNVEKAILALKSADALSPASLRALNEQELAALIYSAGYYNAKARKLKALADFLRERFDDDLDEMAQEAPATLREELLGVHGIGEETADDILLYALGMPSFVVDSFTRRILFRLGLAPENGPYSTYQDLFTINLPPDPQLLGEYHALMVRHGGTICKKRPLCHGCCLLEICPTGRLNVARRPALHATDRG
jgi:endonuclease-3 related protein